MHEDVPRFAADRDIRHQRRCRRLLERIEQIVLVHPRKAREQIEAERLAGERCDGQDAAAVVADAFETLSDHQRHAARDVGVGDRKVGAPAAALVEQLAALVQVPEQLFHEEGVALGLGVDHRGQLRGRRAAGAALEERGHAGFGEAPEPDLLHGALAQQLGSVAASAESGFRSVSR